MVNGSELRIRLWGLQAPGPKADTSQSPKPGAKSIRIYRPPAFPAAGSGLRGSLSSRFAAR